MDAEGRILRFLSEDLGYHSEIHHKYVKNGHCVGGGRVKMDENTKTLEICGYSESYGRVTEKYRPVMRQMLEKQYPDYKIRIN